MFLAVRSGYFAEKVALLLVAALILGIVWAVRSLYLHRKTRQAQGKPEVLEELKRRHENGANYEEMARFLKANGVPRAVADELIAELELRKGR